MAGHESAGRLSGTTVSCASIGLWWVTVPIVVLGFRPALGQTQTSDYTLEARVLYRGQTPVGRLHTDRRFCHQPDELISVLLTHLQAEVIMPATWELLVAGLLVAQSTAIPQPEPPPHLKLYDHVEVTDDTRTIRGRMTQLTADALVVQGDRGRVSLPLATVQRIDRVGDSLLDGTVHRRGRRRRLGACADGQAVHEQQVLGHLGEPRSAFRGVRNARRGRRRRLDRQA